MLNATRRVDYMYVTVPNKPGEAARVLEALREGAVNLLVFQDPCRGHEASDLTRRLRRWLAYVTGPGQSMIPAPAFAPLSPETMATARARTESLRCHGKPLLTS